MRTTLLIVAFVWLIGSGCVAQRNRAGVVKAMEELRLALTDPTEARLSALVADSLTYGHSSGNVEDKAAFLRALLTGASDFKTITFVNPRVTVLANTAVVRHGLQAETLNNGVPGTVNLSVLLVWVYQRGRWLLLARQAVRP